MKNEDLSDLQAAKDFLSSSLYGEHPLARAAHTIIRGLNLANEAADMIAKEREAWKRSCLEWKSLAIKNDARCEAAEQALEGMREALFMCATHCQGGHSDAGAAAADALGVPFPITMPDMITKARSLGLNPARLWSWMIRMTPLGSENAFTDAEIEAALNPTPQGQNQ